MRSAVRGLNIKYLWKVKLASCFIIQLTSWNNYCLHYQVKSNDCQTPCHNIVIQETKNKPTWDPNRLYPFHKLKAGGSIYTGQNVPNWHTNNLQVDSKKELLCEPLHHLFQYIKQYSMMRTLMLLLWYMNMNFKQNNLKNATIGMMVSILGLKECCIQLC